MKTKLVGIMLAVMVASQGMVAFAAPADNNPKGDQHTTIGIMEAEKPVGQASFEVPLYVTTAAIKGQAALMCPEGYDIRNTAKDPDAHDIGVISVKVERVGTWNTVSTTPNDKYDVKLVIGDLVLPEVNAQKTTNTVDFINNYTGGKNAFYGQTTENKVTAIKKGETLAQAGNQIAPGSANYKGLDITGEVQAVNRTNVKAAAQFRVTYVVSALDANGDPIGNTYVGDDKTAAGLNHN